MLNRRIVELEQKAAKSPRKAKEERRDKKKYDREKSKEDKSKEEQEEAPADSAVDETSRRRFIVNPCVSPFMAYI